MNYNDLKNDIRMDDLRGDVFGTAINWQFAVADELHFNRSISCPQEWEFSPGMDSDDDGLWGSNLSEFETSDLIRFGNLLHRLVRAATHAGLSY